MQDSQLRDLTFIPTLDLKHTLQFKLVQLVYESQTSNLPMSEVYFTFQVFANNKPLCMPIKTPFMSGRLWNTCVSLPVLYSNLPLDSQIAVTIWTLSESLEAIPLAGTTFKIFGKYKTLKMGKYRLKLWKGVVSDGSMCSQTPSKVQSHSEMDRLFKLMRKYDRGDIKHIEWMDQFAFQYMDNQSKLESSNEPHLYLEMPVFDFPVVYDELKQEFPLPDICTRVSGYTLYKIVDLDMFRDNPVENKHRKLIRSHRNGPMDRDLKPNSKIRDDLNRLLRYPPSKSLTVEEKDLLWKFRFYLTRDKKALTKFLKSVTWEDALEIKQAVELLPVWVDIDIEDALELLGPAFKDANVQKHAVEQLKSAEDEELNLYLLQLVQALKFGYAQFPLNQAQSPLEEFLISKSLFNPILGNNFYWYLKVESEDKQYGPIYSEIMNHYMSALGTLADGERRLDIIKRQNALVTSLSLISKELRGSKETRPKKIERLIAFIKDSRNGLLSFAPLPLPLDAKVQIVGMNPDKAYIFKSALFPFLLSFYCLDGSEYQLIYKTGDDLRQDQLIIQIITLMDRLLRKENLDLKLTPYKVLATGLEDGMVQFIPSKPIASILSEHNSNIHSFFKTGLDGETIPLSVLENYVRSTAGYSVITYLLGIGDRHLDNIMLTNSGLLFHIDFGYILGRDPKPFPPPIKICKEMVEAMGGTSSPQYQRFKSFCFVAFTCLRKSANLILNLFALMIGTNIQDIALEPDKVVSKVQERFRLDLNDEDAIKFLAAILDESMSAFFPQMMEQLHKVAQLWRS